MLTANKLTSGWTTDKGTSWAERRRSTEAQSDAEGRRMDVGAEEHADDAESRMIYAERALEPRSREKRRHRRRGRSISGTHVTEIVVG